MDNNEETKEQANKILNRIVKNVDSFDDFKIVGKPMLSDLVIHLDKNKSNALIMTGLIGLAEHIYLVQILQNNLEEATRLLKNNNIPFDSVVRVDGDDE